MMFNDSRIGLAMSVLTSGGLPETPVENSVPGRWPARKIWDWYNVQPWLVGFNFLPSTAVNDTEMWQAETFDPGTMDRELGWARQIGFNSCRVFLQYVVWKADPEGFKGRFDRFLSIADKHAISVMPILFDDCAFDNGRDPYLGVQDDPIPGVHNGRWVPSPGANLVRDVNAWHELERYVKDVIASFGHDKRVVIWDLYNEPRLCDANGNCVALSLVENTFRWAREVAPVQPLTTCIFGPPELAERILELSDLINLHRYDGLEGVKDEVAARKRHGRPIIISEWMARITGSRFQTHLPFFKEERIGCFNWGLVAGRTQTYYPWGSPKDAPEPELWLHDVLRHDGTPFDPEEILTIQRCTGVQSEAAGMTPRRTTC